MVEMRLILSKDKIQNSKKLTNIALKFCIYWKFHILLEFWALIQDSRSCSRDLVVLKWSFHYAGGNWKF